MKMKMKTNQPAKKKAKSKVKKTPKVSQKGNEESLDNFLQNWSDDEGDEKEEEVKESDPEEVEDDEAKEAVKSQKKYLSSLEKKDPEFYKFLKENDEELLNFDDSSSDEDGDDKDEDKVHVPPESLEIASDESDYEAEEDEDAKAATKGKKVNNAMIEEWTAQLQSNKPTIDQIGNVIDAFRSAVSTIGTTEEEEVRATRFRVEGGAMFNAVTRLCVTQLESAFKRFLKVAPEAKNYHQSLQKSKTWSKANKHLKGYTMDLIRLLNNASEASVISVLLKHVHQMASFFAVLPKSAKHLVKTLINLWSTGEDVVRILAFLCIIRLTRMMQDTMIESVIKQMYMAYVKNCKFTSPTTLPMINFMRRSLTELLNLDHAAAYHHGFIYIRQMAIHLRNAITLQKKDSTQAVYNWQFVHSLHLWAHLLGAAPKSQTLEPLVYPLCQVIIGTIKLVYVPKYYPLRFHLAKVLTKLSHETGKFIPVLPYYLDVLNNFNFSKKSSKVTMKPMDFSCILKLSKSQMMENGFKDTTMEHIHNGIFEYLHFNAHKIGFPELVTPAVFQLKAFMKKCKVANYCKKIKQILDKTSENSKFIESRRRKVSFGVADHKAVVVWEAKIRSDGTPLTKFYSSWRKIKQMDDNKAKSEKLDLEYDFVPKMKKKAPKKDAETEFKGIFGDDDEDEESDDEERFKLKEERGKKRSKEESDSDSEEEDDDADEPPRKSKKEMFEEARKKAQEEDEEDGDEEDEVKELNLDDLESEEDDDDVPDDEFEESEGGESDEESDDD